MLLLSIFEAKSQNLTGRIVNKLDGKGICNAHIFYPETLTGSVTDSSGNFVLKLNPNFDKIIISSIGFNDTTLETSKLPKDTIYLTEKIYPIEEVSVFSSRKEEKIIGCKKKNPNDITFNLMGKENNNWSGFFMYFQNKSNAKVESVGIHIRKIKNSNAKLHFRILEPDTTFNTLGKDKLKEDLIIEHVREGWNTVDLSDEIIYFPEKGLIVVFYISGLEKDEKYILSGICNEPDYSWMSSTNYMKDFSLTIGNKKYKPALRMTIIE